MGKSRITAGNRQKSSVDLSPGIFQRCNCRGSQEPWGSRSCCWGSTFFTLFWRKTNRSWPHCWQNKRSLWIHKFLHAPAGIFDKSEPARSCYCWHFISHREPLRSHRAVSGCSFKAALLQIHPGLPYTHIFLHLESPLQEAESNISSWCFSNSTDYTGWLRCQTALDVQLVSTQGQVDESCLASDTMPALIVMRISGMSLWI